MAGECNPCKEMTSWTQRCQQEYDDWAVAFAGSRRGKDHAGNFKGVYQYPKKDEQVLLQGFKRSVFLNGAHGKVLSEKIDNEGRVKVMIGSGQGSDSRKMLVMANKLRPLESPLRRSASTPTSLPAIDGAGTTSRPGSRLGGSQLQLSGVNMRDQDRWRDELRQLVSTFG
eukprot:TRINITY_DN82038_c0_g1_i1.p1 TRINITY_DN82038_c0_g1~~TRINITY_DN82038_c0_g1_i1.p1  ORF type:complete len:170 (-),score=30.44 TRINITY_DN82038_c0_g1_i1:159-668(-)